MKRATREWLRRHAAGGHWQTSESEAAQDILDTIARQASELRRLRKERKELRMHRVEVLGLLLEGYQGTAVQQLTLAVGPKEAARLIGRAALKPARRKP